MWLAILLSCMICTTCCSVSRVSPLTREPDSSSGWWLALFVIITIIIIFININYNNNNNNNNNHTIIIILAINSIIAIIITFSPPPPPLRAKFNFRKTPSQPRPLLKKGATPPISQKRRRCPAVPSPRDLPSEQQKHKNPKLSW